MTRAPVRPALFIVASLASLGCETETEVLFGEPDEIVGASAATVSSGGSCVPDLSCDVSFRDDIFPALSETASCGSVGCHATAIAQFEFPPNAGGARQSLIDYVYQGSERYIVPCEPTLSRMLCNLNLGEDPATSGVCGSPMPKLLDDAVADEPLTEADLTAIETWIACGAPDN